jgi:hypothetical protein
MAIDPFVPVLEQQIAEVGIGLSEKLGDGHYRRRPASSFVSLDHGELRPLSDDDYYPRQGGCPTVSMDDDLEGAIDNDLRRDNH